LPTSIKARLKPPAHGFAGSEIFAAWLVADGATSGTRTQGFRKPTRQAASGSERTRTSTGVASTQTRSPGFHRGLSRTHRENPKQKLIFPTRQAASGSERTRTSPGAVSTRKPRLSPEALTTGQSASLPRDQRFRSNPDTRSRLRRTRSSRSVFG